MNQQLMFLNAMLHNIKRGISNNNITTISCHETHEQTKIKIEVYPGDGFIAYRLNGGHWNTWETESDIERTFKLISII